MKYEAKASVQVAWKGEKTLVIDKKELDVVESFEQDFGRSEPEGVVVGENGKIFVQGRVVGGVLISGESGCVELQVKNHSSKKVRLPQSFVSSPLNYLTEHRVNNHAFQTSAVTRCCPWREATVAAL